ncbi:IclR family transcriptional regulator [Cognatishimia sp. D5M38]|uniref:IclR family transcriptional regulator n=1 Tax=Cognatishimia coralii TaxID=3083254 RepID=A0ABU8QFY0_9RHOB
MSTPLNGSVLKAFSILGLFSKDRPEITANSVASELGTNVATAHRFLLTLESIGVLVSYRRGYFALGGTIEELGRLAESVNPISTKVQPIINEVAREIRESVMVCRLGRRGPTCIAVAVSDQPISVKTDIGTVLPIDVTAHGRLWLTHMSKADRAHWLKGTSSDLDDELAKIKSQGFAQNQGDNEPDLGAVAVPVFGHDGKLAMTVSVFGMLSRFNDSLVSRSVTSLKQAARAISS